MVRHHLLLIVIIFKTILTTSIHTERKGENKKGNLKMYYLYCEGFYIMAILFFHFNYSLKAFKIQGRESKRRYFFDIVGCNYDSNNVIVIGKGNSDMLDQWLLVWGCWDTGNLVDVEEIKHWHACGCQVCHCEFTLGDTASLVFHSVPLSS